MSTIEERVKKVVAERLNVKEEDISQFNYEPLPYRQYRHLDGSWKGW